MTVLMEYVSRGDVEKVTELVPVEYAETIIGTCARVCDDPYKNAEYLTVLWIQGNMITATNAGVPESDVDRVSDYFLMKLSRCREIKEIYAIVADSIAAFAGLVRKHLSDEIFNLYIKKTEDYVDAHLTQRIFRRDIAKKLGISENYLSRVFREETGETLNHFIMRKKIEAAEMLLMTTDRNVLAIAHYLSFADESYFCRCFQRETGMTPLEFRQRNTSPT